MRRPCWWLADWRCGGSIRDSHQPAPSPGGKAQNQAPAVRPVCCGGGTGRTLGLAIWFIGHTIIAGYVDGQEEKNVFLKQAIAVLDKEISEIKGLREQAEALLSRKQVIESLQTNRTETVQIFNELARQMPEGIYLKSLKQTGSKINLVGFAQSNARVSNLMRNLDASPHLERADLVEVKAAGLNTRRGSAFSLNV